MLQSVLFALLAAGLAQASPVADAAFRCPTGPTGYFLLQMSSKSATYNDHYLRINNAAQQYDRTAYSVVKNTNATFFTIDANNYLVTADGRYAEQDQQSSNYTESVFFDTAAGIAVAGYPYVLCNSTAAAGGKTRIECALDGQPTATVFFYCRPSRSHFNAGLGGLGLGTQVGNKCEPVTVHTACQQ